MQKSRRFFDFILALLLRLYSSLASYLAGLWEADGHIWIPLWEGDGHIWIPQTTHCSNGLRYTPHFCITFSINQEPLYFFFNLF
jgi:hypothetical protein